MSCVCQRGLGLRGDCGVVVGDSEMDGWMDAHLKEVGGVHLACGWYPSSLSSCHYRENPLILLVLS